MLRLSRGLDPNSAAASLDARKSTLGSMLHDPCLPEIMLTTKDVARLAPLVGDFFHFRSRAQAFLASELDRATIVPPTEIREETVTMRSLVCFRDRERTQRALLVYPWEAGLYHGRLSVLAPAGTALLGLSVGQSMPYEAADGSLQSLTVLEIPFQPEAFRMTWL